MSVSLDFNIFGISFFDELGELLWILDVEVFDKGHANNSVDFVFERIHYS